MTGGGFGCWAVEIWNAATNTRVSPAYSTCASTGPGFLEPFALPADGAYRVVVNPNLRNTGTAAVHLYDVVDVTTPITPNGGATPLALLTPGQVGRLTFSGVATHKATMTVSVTSGSFGCWGLKLLRPDSTTLSTWSQCTGNVTRGPVTLQSTGVHTIVVDPGLSGTGTANVSLTLVP